MSIYKFVDVGDALIRSIIHHSKTTKYELFVASFVDVNGSGAVAVVGKLTKTKYCDCW